MRILLIVFSLLAATLMPGTGVSHAAEPAGEPRAVALPPGTLDAAQVKALFLDKTVTSVTAAKARESISYYDPVGGVRQVTDGQKRLGRWHVTDNGRMCLQMENLPEKCRIIVNDKGVYKKYIVKKNGNHEHSVTYKDFKPGNPLGL